MHRRHLAFLLLAIILVGGSLGWTVGYGLYIRSDAYRHEVIADVTQFLSLPCEIAQVRPLTFSSRLFEDVRVSLPSEAGEVFACRQAIWSEFDSAARNELDLIDGFIRLGADRWDRGDYLRLVDAGLKRDLDVLHLARVGLRGFEVLFERGSLRILCRGAAGTIDLADPAQRVARLVAYELNGYPISAGVQIHARFRPGKGLDVADLSLSLPEVPLHVAGLSAILGKPGASGRFAGAIHYVASDELPEVSIRGELRDAELADVTRGLPWGPLKGRLSIKLTEARFLDAALTDLSAEGEVADLALAPFAPLLSADGLSGAATFSVASLDIRDGELRDLRLSGSLQHLSIDEWLRPLGRGSAQGQLSVRISNLELAGEVVRSADIELSLVPPTDRPGTIDRGLLLAVAEKAFRFTWPSALPQELLPERIEYAECGLRLVIRDNRLRILGTHGPKNETVLTVRVMGRSFGVLKEPSGLIDLTPHIQRQLERLRQLRDHPVRQLLTPVLP